jgi:hypothetical protein
MLTLENDILYYPRRPKYQFEDPDRQVPEQSTYHDSEFRRSDSGTVISIHIVDSGGGLCCAGALEMRHYKMQFLETAHLPQCRPRKARHRTNSSTVLMSKVDSQYHARDMSNIPPKRDRVTFFILNFRFCVLMEIPGR